LRTGCSCLRRVIIATTAAADFLTEHLQPDDQAELAIRASNGDTWLKAMAATGAGQPPTDKFGTQRLAVLAFGATDPNPRAHEMSSENSTEGKPSTERFLRRRWAARRNGESWSGLHALPMPGWIGQGRRAARDLRNQLSSVTWRGQSTITFRCGECRKTYSLWESRRFSTPSQSQDWLKEANAERGAAETSRAVDSNHFRQALGVGRKRASFIPGKLIS
jgi:hypothetical protein